MEVESQENPGKNDSSVLPAESVISNNTSKVRADFEGLLELAETLKNSLDNYQERYRVSHTVLQILILLLVTEMYSGVLIAVFGIGFHHAVPRNHSLTSPIATILAFTDVLFALVTATYAYSFWFRSKGLKSAGRADKQDLIEVVELLREIEPVVAKEESLSALERVQIRIRLSRFGVGSSVQDHRAIASRELEDDFHARKSRVDKELAKPF